MKNLSSSNLTATNSRSMNIAANHSTRTHGMNPAYQLHGLKSMRATIRHYRYATILVIAIGLVLFALPSVAETEASKQTFEKCVDAQITNERAKTTPKVARVLSACETEFTAFLQSLPPGPSGDLRHLAEKYVKKQLKE